MHWHDLALVVCKLVGVHVHLTPTNTDKHNHYNDVEENSEMQSFIIGVTIINEIEIYIFRRFYRQHADCTRLHREMTSRDGAACSFSLYLLYARSALCPCFVCLMLQCDFVYCMKIIVKVSLVSVVSCGLMLRNSDVFSGRIVKVYKIDRTCA